MYISCCLLTELPIPSNSPSSPYNPISKLPRGGGVIIPELVVGLGVGGGVGGIVCGAAVLGLEVGAFVVGLDVVGLIVGVNVIGLEVGISVGLDVLGD